MPNAELSLNMSELVSNSTVPDKYVNINHLHHYNNEKQAAITTESKDVQNLYSLIMKHFQTCHWKFINEWTLKQNLNYTILYKSMNMTNLDQVAKSNAV